MRRAAASPGFSARRASIDEEWEGYPVAGRLGVKGSIVSSPSGSGAERDRKRKLFLCFLSVIERLSLPILHVFKDRDEGINK